MIRITGGYAKGRALKVYQGGQVRPTSDKVRQAIFNILEHRYDLEFYKVSALDLFAGSGSLGLDMLSREGRSVTFVESDPKAASVLRRNLKVIEDAEPIGRTTHENSLPQVGSKSKKGQLMIQCVDRFLRRSTSRPFEVIFADPPYRDERIPELLTRLASGWVSPQSIVVIEHAKRNLFELPPSWALDDRRSYGDTLVSFVVPEVHEF